MRETGSGNQYSISLSFPPRRSPAGAQPGAGKRGSQWEAVRAQCRGLGKPPSLVSCVGDAREKGSESNIQSNADLQRRRGRPIGKLRWRRIGRRGFHPPKRRERWCRGSCAIFLVYVLESFGDMNFDLTGDLSFLLSRSTCFMAAGSPSLDLASFWRFLRRFRAIAPPARTATRRQVFPTARALSAQGLLIVQPGLTETGYRMSR